MKFRVATVCLVGAMLVVLAVFWQNLRNRMQTTHPDPLSPPIEPVADNGVVEPAGERGVVVPVADYRFSGPFCHDNLTIYLVHGPQTLDGKSFLTLSEALGRVDNSWGTLGG